MNDILIGSTAINYHGVQIRDKPKDFDLIVLNPPKGYSGEIVDFIQSEELYNLLKPYCTSISGTKLLVPDLDTLMVLKISHMNQTQSWIKHYRDIERMLKAGAKFDPERFDKFYQFWVKYFPLKKQINLNVPANEFFNQNPPENHEALHNHFKFGLVPAYQLFQKDNCEVMCDESKFNKLSKEERIHSVIEESMVIAYERNISFLKGYSHVLTSLSKGWWNKFAVSLVPCVIQNEKCYSDIFKVKGNQYGNS